MRICIQNYFFIIFPILTELLSLTNSQYELYNCIKSGGNYTNNSTYQSNFNALLSSIPFHIDEYGFGNYSFGKSPDTTYSLSLCRGDKNLTECRSCIRKAIVNSTQTCGNHKEAIWWNEFCTLSYSSNSLYDKLREDPSRCLYNINNVTNLVQFNKDLRSLLDDLRVKAASGSSHRKFATGNKIGADLATIFGLMQCTPDLSEKECSDCLVSAMGKISSCSPGKVGMRVLLPSCNLRYEISSFYGDTAGPKDDILPPAPAPILQPPPPPLKKDGKSNNKTTTIIIIVASSIVFVILLTACICFLLRKRRPRRNSGQNSEIRVQNESSVVDDMKIVESLQYDFDTVVTATDNFSDSNKLGAGGFGAVYKGVLPDGVEIAVKRLSENSHQGEVEFKNEVVLVAKLQHRNLVRLLGFCYKQTERLLIYEFMKNSSLDHFLFDPTKRKNLNWDRRYKIIGGIARGLLYLHEDSRLRIIHRDLKASNVLLDDEMNPKISDFGMARLFVMDETHGSTSRIVGTYGYMSPEYAMHGHFSVKSDVFSFGVLILEIVSGQKNSYFSRGETGDDLLSFAWNSWRQGKALNLVDHSLLSTMNSTSEIMRYMHIGLLCVHENPADRPTMAQVVLMLTSMSITLPVPSQPAFFLQSIASPEMPLLSEYDSEVTDRSSSSRNKIIHLSDYEASINDTSITDVYPR